MTRSTDLSQHAPVQFGATVVGTAFLLVGVLGFVPGVTSHFSDLSVAGRGSGAELLAVFQVSVLHNVVHVLLGVVGLALASTAAGARGYLIGGGVAYLALSVYGFLVGQASTANVVPLNSADNWLHVGLGVSMIGLGAMLAQRTVTDIPRRPATVAEPASGAET